MKIKAARNSIETDSSGKENTAVNANTAAGEEKTFLGTEPIGRLLFKLAVEHNMTNHLLGGDVDMTREEYNKMRGSSVREVSATHGAISFKDVLLFYQGE